MLIENKSTSKGGIAFFMYAKAIDLLVSSIFSNDILMFIFFIITWFFLIFTIIFRNSVKKRIEDWKMKRNVPFTKFVLNGISRSYTLFTTMITIFPLLGMLGTVCGLLGLDLANGDMDNIKNNFFIALTSTAWGIIFSGFFKIINAFISDSVEEQISNAKKLSEDIYFRGGR